MRNVYTGRLQGSQWDWRESTKTPDKHPVSNAGLGLGRPGALLRRELHNEVNPNQGRDSRGRKVQKAKGEGWNKDRAAAKEIWLSEMHNKGR